MDRTSMAKMSNPRSKGKGKSSYSSGMNKYSPTTKTSSMGPVSKSPTGMGGSMGMVKETPTRK